MARTRKWYTLLAANPVTWGHRTNGGDNYSELFHTWVQSGGVLTIPGRKGIDMIPGVSVSRNKQETRQHCRADAEKGDRVACSDEASYPLISTAGYRVCRAHAIKSRRLVSRLYSLHPGEFGTVVYIAEATVSHFIGIQSEETDCLSDQWQRGYI